MSSEDRLNSALTAATFNRPPRLQFPHLNDDRVEIPSPPALPPLPDQNLLVALLPVLGIGVMAVFYVFRAATSSDSGFFAIPMLFLGLFTIGGTLIAYRWRRADYQRRVRDNELKYLRLLASKRVRLQAAHDAQLGILETNYPEPSALLNRALTRDPQLWERRPEDLDFIALRLGVGRVPSSVSVIPPTAEIESPLLSKALALADAYRTLDSAPVIASLKQDVSIGFSGRRAQVLQAIRAVLCQLAITHAPQDLHIHLIASQSHYEDWRWLEWLPHASQNHQSGAADLTAFDSDNITNLMGNLAQVIDERKEHKSATRIPHLLLVVDDPELIESEPVYLTIMREGNLIGASALCLVDSFESIPADCGAVVEIEPDGQFRYARTGPAGVEIVGQAIDRISAQNSEHVARALASVMVREIGQGGRVPRRVDFLSLYNVRSVEELLPQINLRWQQPVPTGVLPRPVLIGSESHTAHTEILLDEDHHGPHGILAGTTGSGKSELLQTLICSLVLEHDPRLLNLLLVDFKGGSTFNVFADLPHTVGMVTNLDGVRVGRVLEALKTETQWRQQFLKSMNVRDIRQYHRYYSRTVAQINAPEYKPLPHLFIIVDEFAQLAKEMPNFLSELVRTAQLGRSLGLHLILGTQSPMDVITDEMNANVQFRICLRVSNIEASRAMLRRPDAAYLPSGWPGRGYFQVGEQGVFKQFQTAYVGGDYISQSENSESQNSEKVVLELITDRGETIDLLALGASIQPIQIEESRSVARAICDTVIQYAVSENIPPMRPLLLPPLEDRITLAAPLERASTGGWNGHEWRLPGFDHEGYPIKTGSAPVGLLDDIYNRTQHPLWINLNTSDRTQRKDGHLIVVGNPGTGKTMLLRTLAISEALLHPPDKLHMYFLSFTGTGLDDLGSLPHAERVIHSAEAERVRRLFGRLIELLNKRQFGLAEPFAPIIMVVIDQYEQFRDSYRDQHMAEFERLVNEGRAVGIYLVMTVNNITVIPDRIRSVIEQRIALQLGDTTDYLIAVGRLNTSVEGALPAGRGFFNSSPALACQISLPITDPTPKDERETLETMRGIIGELRAQGVEGYSLPAPIQELPTHMPLYTLSNVELPERQNEYHLITPLGRCDDDSLSVYTLDWWQSGSHFVVTGPPGSGKTNLLQTAIFSAAQRYSPRQARFLLVDFNGRSFRAVSQLKHVIRRVTDPAELETQLAHLHSELTAFDQQAQDHDSPPPFPATVVMIDDYDVVSETLRVDSIFFTQLRDHARLSHLNLSIWVAGYLERIGDPLIRYLLLKRAGFALGVKESLQKLNVRTSGLSNEVMPDGRGYIAQDNTLRVAQFALVENPPAYIRWINDELWGSFDHAVWEISADARPARKASSKSARPPQPESPAEIDTAGLMDDLLSGVFEPGHEDH